MKTTEKPIESKPRQISTFKFLRTGDLSPKGFDIYEIHEGQEITVRNLREVTPGIYKDSKDFEFHQV